MIKYSGAGVILLIVFSVFLWGYPLEKFNFLYYPESGVVPRHLHPKVGIYYWSYTGAEYFNNDGHREDYNTTYSENWVVPSFSFGAGDAVEFGAYFPVLSEKYERDNGIWGTSTNDGSGLGDITVWVKALVTHNPNFGLRVAAKLATGDDAPGDDKLPTGTGQTDIDMGFVLSQYPEKMGFACDVAMGFRLRLSKEIEGGLSNWGDAWYIHSSGTYDPGDEGRLQLYLGGMPMEGFGILFGGDGFISLNDRFEGEEITKSYRASAMLGMKMFFETKFGLRFDGGIKFDIAGKDYPAGYGFMLGATFQPQY